MLIRTLCLAGALAASTTAHAQTLPAYPPVAKGPQLSLAPIAPKAVAMSPVTYDRAPTPLPRGVAKTSVERRDGAVSGGIGVLCGIQPSADDSGVGTARGYNTEGRFVGAKLGFSF